MMKVVYGQSVKDICLMVYGSINQIGQLIEDNGYKLDSFPTPGTDIIYDENLGNDVIKNFYTRKNIIPSSYINEMLCGTFTYIDETCFLFIDGTKFDYI